MWNRRSSCALIAALLAVNVGSAIGQPPQPIPGKLRQWPGAPPFPDVRYKAVAGGGAWASASGYQLAIVSSTGSEDGSMHVWGSNFYWSNPQQGVGPNGELTGAPFYGFNPGQKIIGIAGGLSHAIVIYENHTIYGWRSSEVELADPAIHPPPGAIRFRAVSAGEDFSMGIIYNPEPIPGQLADNTLVTWGSNYSFDPTTHPNRPPAGTQMKEISAGGHHALAVGVNGTLYAWGPSSQGLPPTGMGPNGTLWADHLYSHVAGGHYFSTAMTTNGFIVSWGESGQDLVHTDWHNATYTHLAAGYRFGMALKSDGTVFGWGTGYAPPDPLYPTFQRIGAGWYRRLGIEGCYANCDGSTIEPVYNVLDFMCFNNLFASGDPAANCDGSTIAPTLNVQDFQCFNNKFVSCAFP